MGNGQVLTSMLMSHEGQGLPPVITGMVNRYKALLYVDRDRCSAVGSSRWDDLVVRLDVWHFMLCFGTIFLASRALLDCSCTARQEVLQREGSHFLSTVALEGPHPLSSFITTSTVSYLKRYETVNGRAHLGGLSSPVSSGPRCPDGVPDNLVEIEDEGYGDEEEGQDLTISPLSLMSTKETIRLCQDVLSSSQSSQNLLSEPKEERCRRDSRV